MRTILVILFTILCTHRVSCQDNQKLNENSENNNYLKYTVEGKSFLVKDSIDIEITVSLTSPSIIYNFCGQEKNRQIQFKWEKMDQTNDVGTFSILNGHFTDSEKNIKNKEVTGKVVIKKANYKSHINRIIALEGLYEISINMPDKTKQIINGNFFYEGEYTISL